VLLEFDLEDAASLAVLRHAAEAEDRAEGLKAEVVRDGLTVAAPGGPKAHPALQAEAVARNLVIRSLARLGILDEARRDRPGRPPGRGAA
jgi:hypothetical protein